MALPSRGFDGELARRIRDRLRPLRTEPQIPDPDRLMTDQDAAFGQKVFDTSQG